MEEKNRRRNTGFVCFMNRDDAEEALEACDDTDPFNSGRLLRLRWGKNVKKTSRNTDQSTKTSIPRRQKGADTVNKESRDSTAPPASTTTRSKVSESSKPDRSSTTNNMQAYDPEIHGSRAIRVEIPKDRSRFHFISTAASYVAKDPEIEPRLRDEEKGNLLFEFLTRENVSDDVRKEQIFYKWRVYSFCQGDTYSIWRTEPFAMFPQGRYWIPPPLDEDAANTEKANAAEKERRRQEQKEGRVNRELMTGRQFERRKRRGDFGGKNPTLNPEESSRFDKLVRKQLSISRKTICEAMSFCFDNCAAAQEVSALLKMELLDDSNHVTNDMRIARLYLLSDILFNSQQPGVRNAFMYRTTIESMAAEVFRDLGSLVRRKERSSGRITVNKLRKAVSAVLGAWTEWGVYNATFVDELEAHFDGREVKCEANEVKNSLDADAEKNIETEIQKEEEDIVIHGQRGDWKQVDNEANSLDVKESVEQKAPMKIAMKHPLDTPQKRNQFEASRSADETHNSVMDYTQSGKEIDRNDNSSAIDGDEIDGEDLDGEDLDGEDLDGEDIDGEDLDGDDLDVEDIDGEDIDGEDIDGEELMAMT
eukprot:CAMPEP_0201219214 /NCGR_PEP_ID=MMETSP0851-20130426/190966_1 /ASSEMBLY_ACC=CAM_ASM_000631 /TAXON_ID=183588 /ORGANISM="Pseudo-nitzschia fraudulenta, Strain WWA7" /LENGTH=591 /DNA_ID=CAMNT_0047508903 /DNA_START=615 /DNA_END=2390 /DNA_ORIENTATION=-